ncbi:MAG TPA: NUDIX hydrolase [Solirubrobacteraceae bacterium]|nr:NUDIX hydrolase [Solirubrobacteraceae bacterium]
MAGYAVVDVDRPHVSEELTTGEVATPRPAATVILLRGGAETLEVLLVKRNPERGFMAGAWVFPGGSVQSAEGSDDEAHRQAALRELEEEAGVALTDPGQLVPFSRWITPAQVKKRFDTWFYLAPAPGDAAPRCDGQECVDLGWFTPQGALDAHKSGEIMLVFPTIKTLEQLGRFDTADALLEHTRGREVRPVEPRVLISGETARVVLPGEPGYDA